MRDCDLIESFVDYLKFRRHRAERTARSYTVDLYQFLDFLTGMQTELTSNQQQKPETVYESLLCQAEPGAVKGFMEFLMNGSYSVASARRKLATLSCFYDYLVSEEFIYSNPTVVIVPPKVEKHHPNILTDEQIYNLVHSPDSNDLLGKRDTAILYLLCFTGIRVSELVRLNINDIDFQVNKIRITSSAGKSRWLVMDSITSEVLKKYIDAENEQFPSQQNESEDKAVFINKFLRRMDTRSADRRVEKYLRQIELGFISPYDLRHSYACKLIKDGSSALQLYNELGFESLAAAKSYIEEMETAAICNS